MDKLLFFSKDSDNLSIGFHREITTREKEMTKNEKQEEFYPVRVFENFVFDFAVHQANATFGLVFKLTLQKIMTIMYQVIKQELLLQILH